MGEVERIRGELQCLSVSSPGPLSYTGTVSWIEMCVPEILEVYFRVALVRKVLYPESCYTLVLRLEGSEKRNVGSYFLAYSAGTLSVLLSSPATDHLLPPLIRHGPLRRLDLHNEHLGTQGTASLVGALWERSEKIPLELGLFSSDLLRFLGHLPFPLFYTLHSLGDRSQNFLVPLEETHTPYPHPLTAPNLYAQDLPGLQKILRYLPRIQEVGFVVRFQNSVQRLDPSELTELENSLLSKIQKKAPTVHLIPYGARTWNIFLSNKDGFVSGMDCGDSPGNRNRAGNHRNRVV